MCVNFKSPCTFATDTDTACLNYRDWLWHTSKKMVSFRGEYWKLWNREKVLSVLFVCEGQQNFFYSVVGFCLSSRKRQQWKRQIFIKHALIFGYCETHYVRHFRLPLLFRWDTNHHNPKIMWLLSFIWSRINCAWENIYT